MGFHYRSPLRWGDMDAQGHVNNGVYLDHLQDARVAFLLTGPPATASLLETGVLVVAHQVEYVAPVEFSSEPLEIELWIDRIGASRFVVGYEASHAGTLCLRARTAAVPYDLAGSRLRRLLPAERDTFAAHLTPAEPLRTLPATAAVTEGAHRYPLLVRWGDLDAYGHVNNVTYYDYIQEARIAVIGDSVGWSGGVVWFVARQDVDYVRQLDFRLEPYEVATSVVAVGTRSFTLAAEIRDPADGTVYARARTVAVGADPLTDEQRTSLARWRSPS